MGICMAALFLQACGLGQDPPHKDFEELEIFVQKGGCYGDCPAYDLRVNEAGMLLLDARKHVGREGMFQKKLLPEQMDRLLRLVHSADFESMREFYLENIPDLPATVISVRKDDWKKKIVYDMDYPEGLAEVDAYLTELATDSLGWEPVGD